MPKWLTNYIAKAVAPAVKDLAKADAPQVTEVPTQMQVGYAYTGGARRKYQGIVDFDTLRSFSTVYDVARVCINHRKRQIANLEWNIVPKDDNADPAKFKKQSDAITAFFEEPCHQTDFRMFVDKIIEDLLVVDAAVLWKDVTFGGELKELLPIDGTTIRLKVAKDGTLPEPPEVAFQQIIYGEVKGEWTTDQMIYKMMNPRNNTPYGLSPLESLIIGVDAALRSQMYNASLLSEGSVPEGMLAMPEKWTPDQIKDYQQWFDAMLAGNFSQNTRIKMIPGGKGVGYIPTKKADDMRMLEFEKWLLMKCCAMFDVQPSDIGFLDGMGTNNQEAQQELGNQRGLVPTAIFLKQMFTKIIRDDFGMPELKFEWAGLQVVDNRFELDRNSAMLEHGGMTVNEWRVSQGMDPFEEPMADVPLVYTRTGTVPLGEVASTTGVVTQTGDPNAEGNNTPADQAAQQKADDEVDELSKWQSKCINAIKRGKPVPEFRSSYIDRGAQSLIRARLSVAKSADEIKAAFAPFRDDATERSLIKRAMSVRNDISKHKRDRYERIGSGAK